MKYLILIILSVVAFSATAQKDIAVDSTWITNAGGIFYENHITRYTNGEEENGYKRSLGDTARFYSRYIDRIEQQAELLANDARTVIEYPARVKELIRLDAAIALLISQSPADSIRRKHSKPLIDSTWTIRANRQALPVVFSVNAGGNFRYKIDTLPTRGAVLLGGVLRLNNYAGSEDLVLYKIRDLYYSSIDKTVILKPAGAAQSQNRSVAPTQAQPVEAPKTKRKKRVKVIGG